MKTSYIFIIIVILTGVFGYYLYYPQVTQEKGFVYELHAGTSKKTFVAQLNQQGIIQTPGLFSAIIFFQKNSSLKTGEYFFPKGSTLGSIWRQVTNGRGLVYHHFTIVPGWTFNQLRYELLQTHALKHSITGLNDKQIMEYIGGGGFSPEGEFYPETYYYTKGNADLVILKRAFDLMQLHLSEAWNTRDLSLPYKSAYEGLIAASLVEKEAYLNTERPVIAGVLVNRLNKNMLLQFDPTVIYSLGQRYDGRIHKENLTEVNDYNTYVKKGLPPTPIAIPSQISLSAALHPDHNDYLYFVAKGDGSHVFSKTLPEHNSAVIEVNKNTQPANPLYFNEYRVRKYIDNLFSTTLKNLAQNEVLTQTM